MDEDKLSDDHNSTPHMSRNLQKLKRDLYDFSRKNSDSIEKHVLPVPVRAHIVSDIQSDGITFQAGVDFDKIDGEGSKLKNSFAVMWNIMRQAMSKYRHTVVETEGTLIHADERVCTNCSGILQNVGATECPCGNLNKQIPRTPKKVMFEEKVLPPEDIGTIDTIEDFEESFKRIVGVETIY